MLLGQAVVLRAQRRSDVQTRLDEVEGDVLTHALRSERPWVPVSLETALARFDSDAAGPADPCAVWFSIVRRDDSSGHWAGDAGLWGIDAHSGTAHLALVLSPRARGQGLGADAVRVLCDYGFRVRGLHRLSVETLASNAAALGAARAAGFVEEGRAREAAYVLGERVDEVRLGLLRGEWQARVSP